MTNEVTIALGPDAPAEFSDAIAAGGAVLAAPGTPADGMVWSGYPSEDAAARALEEHDPGWVQLTSSGVEQLLPVLRNSSADRVWTSAKGLFARTVAEHALLLALACLREVKRYARAEAWTPQSGRSLFDRRVLIVGGGGIGRELQNLLTPFTTDTTLVRSSAHAGDPSSIGFDALEDHLGHADVVVLAAPLTERTDGMMDARRLALMDPDAVLVNVARGRLVRTDDLVAALDERRLAAAGIDVTDPEPLPAGHPLWAHERCLITPHTANTWAMSIGPVADRIRLNLGLLRQGRPLEGRVDPVKGY